MPDPIEELDGIFNHMQTRRFWGNFIAGCAVMLLVICVGTGPLAPAPAARPAMLRFAVVAALAGFLLDDEPQRAGLRDPS